MEIKRVCVFASSSNYLDDVYYNDARLLGELIGKNNYDLVYGGSNLGLMWACAEQAKINGAKLIGIMPEKLQNMGVFTEGCDEFYVTKGMRERKAQLDDMSDAVVALAGGFGTLEELSEMIVQRQLGYNKKPIIILNTNGFYDKLMEFFEVIIAQKFANKNMRNLYFMASTPQEAIDYLRNYVPSELNVDKNTIYAR